MEKIGARDLEFIESRLFRPASDVYEAIGRLREVGHGYHADRLTEALQRFTDSCRAIRYAIIDGQKGV
jgi:hypothetical protein